MKILNSYWQFKFGREDNDLRTGRNIGKYEDSIREDIRQEIINSSSNNRYSKQISDLEKKNRKSIFSFLRKSSRDLYIEEEEINSREECYERKEDRMREKRYSQISSQVATTAGNTVEKSKVVHRIPVKQEEKVESSIKSKHSFLKGYLVFCGILVACSACFLTYVWRSISLYERMQPKYILDEIIASLSAGESVDNISFPELETNEFSSVEELQDHYLESMQNAILTYKFLKNNYETGNSEYAILKDDEMVAKVSLAVEHEENRLGILKITMLDIASIEPVMNVFTWEYDIKAFSNQKVYINDIEVSDQYMTEQPKQKAEFAYLYEYVDMPKEVTYHVKGIYNESEIKVIDQNGQEVDCAIDGNIVDATKVSMQQLDTIPEEIASEVDPLAVAKVWSLFTTRDLNGPNYGLDQVRQYFIKDSYYWEKLKEYACGIDITLVSNHNSQNTTFKDEYVTDYCAYSQDCFSCRIHFEKHMLLTIGKDQVDTTDSRFYFVKIDDSDDGVDNPTWKVADIQAVVN